jgi:ferredoxin
LIERLMALTSCGKTRKLVGRDGLMITAFGAVITRCAGCVRCAAACPKLLAQFCRTVRLALRVEPDDTTSISNKKGHPKWGGLICIEMVGRDGFEPSTNWLKVDPSISNQLFYFNFYR